MAEATRPRRPPASPHLGDRLERAIEHRADVEGEIERGEARRPTRARVVRTVVWLVVTAASLYLVLPALLDTLASSDDLDQLAPGWLAAMAALQALTLGCLWALQRIALGTKGWHAVVTSQLAGNGLAKVAPGGGAVGAALQYKMLVQTGLLRDRVVTGLTAANLLTLAVVPALPLLALPAIIAGTVDAGLVKATLLGLGLFAAMIGVGAVLLATDGALAAIGRAIQRARNAIRRKAEPLRGLPDRLLRSRDEILASVGVRWKAALATTLGRWGFDYLTLLAALAAVGSTPRPVLVLLAFCAAQLLAQIPATPGGLGFVEAGLAATLALAGVSAGDAVLATLAYRLVTYWSALPLGLLGAALHRRRYASSTAAGSPG